jgi:hypothetical protein
MKVFKDLHSGKILIVKNKLFVWLQFNRRFTQQLKPAQPRASRGGSFSIIPPIQIVHVKKPGVQLRHHSDVVPA